ncbi:MAG: sigma 54-interacting transcriptional regulator [Planctomycetes bacterium]|nr:sigma 54-interacting transcriptional regulator [Planctomycetota bacterium]
MPFLILERAGEKIAREIGERTVTIGRAVDCDLPIDDPCSSRRHCEVRCVGRGAAVRDLGSRNGTLVNGEKLSGERELADGDEIRIGDCRIRFALSVPVVAPESAGRETAALAGIGAPPRTGCPECARLARVVEVATMLAGETDPERLLARILDAAIDLSGAERGFLVRTDPGGFRISAARNLERSTLERSIDQISRTICAEVAKTGAPLVLADAGRDSRFREAGSVIDLALRSVLCLPLAHQEEILGVLYLDNRFAKGIFGSADAAALGAFASSAAVSLQQARLLARLVQREREIAEMNRSLELSLDERTRELATVKETLATRQAEFETRYSYGRILGKSEAMQKVFRLLDKIVPTDVPVILQGESGTGKELVARAIHFGGPRKAGPFVSLNCAAVAEPLLESELFGHEKGSFTGATEPKKGLFELASGGTLFLDEVADMPAAMQKSLLRALQEGEIRRVGGKDMIRVDVRIVAATNADLRELVEEEGFRADLYYRFAGVTIELPPLRRRPEDIPLLAQALLEETCRDQGREAALSPEALRVLLAHPWPGNVRQLANEIRRAVAVGGESIGPDDFSPELTRRTPPPALEGPVGEATLKVLVEALERKAILDVLARAGGNKTNAAKILGLSRPGLRKKMARYGIEG